MRVAYLGPAGTFTQQAALLFYKGENPDQELLPFISIELVLSHVESGEVDQGVAPLENSTEGVVNATVDRLIFDGNLFIQKQVAIPVAHHLAAKKGAKAPLSKILSKDQALSQCGRNLFDNHRFAELQPVASTAEAARMVSATGENWGAVATELAARRYGLEILQENIQDERDNETKFILVSKNDTSELFPGGKTTIAFSTAHKPGELYKILDIFSLWDVNMTSIVSRPMKKKKGEFVFLVDLEVGQEVNDVADALTMVKRKAQFYKSLGCY